MSDLLIELNLSTTYLSQRGIVAVQTVIVTTGNRTTPVSLKTCEQSSLGLQLIYWAVVGQGC